MIDAARDFYAPGVYNAGMDVKAYAKINLTLDVMGKRADGYHALRTIMLAIDLCDEIQIDFDTQGVCVTADPPLPEKNAALRAAAAYCEKGGTPGAGAHIIRGIPPEAGLGGSSADAAALIRALQNRHHALDEAELAALALSIGSDVPFLLNGGLTLCEGRGEILTPLPFMDLPLLIVQPERGAGTKEVFAALQPPYPAGTTDGALAAIRRGDRDALLPYIGNALTDAACSFVPEIGSLLSRMKEAGAQASSMTGSGSAVFGIFENEAAAQRALAQFRDLPFARVCRGVN